MPNFAYTAITKDGKQVKGVIEAASIDIVRDRLQIEGHAIIDLHKATIWSTQIEFKQKVRVRDLSVFCRQFASILKVGINVSKALSMMADQTENKTLKNALYKTTAYVQQGETLATAMEQADGVFPEMFIYMVEAGESSGHLDTAVERMGLQYEKSAKLAGLVRRALIYPIAVIFIALVVMILMSVLVVPQFFEMFEELGAALPLSTQLLMGISDLLINDWYILLAVTIILILILRWYGTTHPGKVMYGKLALSAPIFGNINSKSYSASFARTMSTLLSSGMDFTRAIMMTAKTLKNVLFKEALEYAKTEVEQGIQLSEPLRDSKLFPPMVTNMMSIGEETGSVEDMLDKVAEYYEEETEIATATLADLMQPIIIVVLGVLVGWMVLAMYQPMIDMYGGMSNL